MSKSDVAFLDALRKARISDPPTQRQLVRMYESIEEELLAKISDFGVEELNQLTAYADVILSRRPKGPPPDETEPAHEQ